jgi:hypothetical protein
VVVRHLLPLHYQQLVAEAVGLVLLVMVQGLVLLLMVVMEELEAAEVEVLLDLMVLAVLVETVVYYFTGKIKTA